MRFTLAASKIDRENQTAVQFGCWYNWPRVGGADRRRQLVIVCLASVTWISQDNYRLVHNCFAEEREREEKPGSAARCDWSLSLGSTKWPWPVLLVATARNKATTNIRSPVDCKEWGLCIARFTPWQCDCTTTCSGLKTDRGWRVDRGRWWSQPCVLRKPRCTGWWVMFWEKLPALPARF